jgi:hypothetical protein
MATGSRGSSRAGKRDWSEDRKSVPVAQLKIDHTACPGTPSSVAAGNSPSGGHLGHGSGRAAAVGGGLGCGLGTGWHTGRVQIRFGLKRRAAPALPGCRFGTRVNPAPGGPRGKPPRAGRSACLGGCNLGARRRVAVMLAVPDHCGRRTSQSRPGSAVARLGPTAPSAGSSAAAARRSVGRLGAGPGRGHRPGRPAASRPLGRGFAQRAEVGQCRDAGVSRGLAAIALRVYSGA